MNTDGEIAEGNIEHRTLNAEHRRTEIAGLCRGAATTGCILLFINQGKVLAHRGFEEKLTVMFSAKPEERGFRRNQFVANGLREMRNGFALRVYARNGVVAFFSHGWTRMGEIAEGNIEHRTSNIERRTSTDRNSGALPRRRYDWGLTLTTRG